MSIRIGIIGAGAIGAVHAQAAKRVGETVVAIADLNLKAAEALAKREGIETALGDPHALLKRDDVQAVVVGVPNKFHAPIAIAALNAGKDVLLEKPMALNVAECKAINAAAKKNKRIVQMGFVNRYTPSAVTARQFVGEGALGDIYHAKANIYRRRGIPGLGGWFTTKSMAGGGPLIDIGVHIIDLAMYVMDFPKVKRVSGKVYAKFGPRMKKYLYEGMWAGPPKYDGVFDVEDSAHALVRLEGGATLEINATWAGNFPDDSVRDIMGFFGDKGGMTFQIGGNQVKVATEQHGHNVDLIPKCRDVNNWDAQHRAFIETVITRKQPHASGERGQIVQSIIDAIYKSSAEDREVEVR